MAIKAMLVGLNCDATYLMILDDTKRLDFLFDIDGSFERRRRWPIYLGLKVEFQDYPPPR